MRGRRGSKVCASKGLAPVWSLLKAALPWPHLGSVVGLGRLQCPSGAALSQDKPVPEWEGAAHGGCPQGSRLQGPVTPCAAGWEAAASLRLPQRRKCACPAAPRLCPLLTLQEGHGGSFCPLGHCLPCKSLFFFLPFALVSSFPGGCPLLEAERSWEDKHPVPFLLPPLVASLSRAASEENKGRAATLCLHTHTHTCPCGWCPPNKLCPNFQPAGQEGREL